MADYLKEDFEFKILINGELQSCDASFDVVNPSTGKPFKKCPSASQQQTDSAVDAAVAAFKTWRYVPLDQRCAAVHKAAVVLEENQGPLIDLLVMEQGKPKAHAAMELGMAIGHLKESSEIKPPVDVYVDDDTSRVEAHRRPVGVVAGITPWNFPIFCSVQKWAPAIALGNTFVHKPSPFTPLTGVAIGMLMKDVFPPGVFNVITGADVPGQFNIGAHLVNHPRINKISFTGSGPTGKKIMAGCANDMKRITLEMGGNDAAIVRADCNVKEVAQKVFFGAMANTGQICCAIKRVYCHRSIFDDFVNELATIAKNAKVGDGFDAATEFGPLNNAKQLQIVEDLVADAKKNNATILAGGCRVEGKEGFFYQPTIITNVDNGSRVVDEEQFGPILPVIPFDDDTEALCKANDSPFGLGGSVWTADLKKASEMAAMIDAGTVWVNDHLSPTKGPFGGMKQSGIGRELGKADIDAFTEIQTIKVPKA